MKKLSKNLKIYICMFVAVFCAMTLKAEAANVTSGTIGDNGGVTWTYDADTKTLTLTGADSGLSGVWDSSIRQDKSKFVDICGDVEVIILKNCTIKKYASDMFANLKSLKTVKLDNVNTSGVISMSGMFANCSSLTELDLRGMDTSNVKGMSSMFSGCSSLERLDLTGFDTSKVEWLDEMFRNCSSLKSLDVSNFDTSQAVSMAHMFNGCSGLTGLDVSGFDTSKCTNIIAMFANCSGLKSLDVSNFNTSNVEYMNNLFSGCSSLTSLDISNFDTSKATLIYSMFENCSELKSLNLGNFEIGEIGSMVTMFEGCSGLRVLDLSSMDISADIYFNNMLRLCDSLEIVHTFKGLNEASEVTLPANFVDSKGKRYRYITDEVCGTTLYREDIYPVVAFVSRMYTVALGRAAEADGLNFYTERLLSGDSNGACLAQSFLCSPEFLNKGYDNAQYVKVLYKTFFDREPAAEEVNYWVGQINSGKSRAFVLAGFVNSVEFDNLCASYGISRGFMREDGKPLNPGIGRFAERLYTVVLERAGEKEGIEYWSLGIANGVCTPKDAAKNFFLSAEYVNKNTSDAKYITTLYKAFMDREPEAGGVEYWQGVLSNGATREQILEGFADSAEFKAIMASFGL